jgi:RNA polymerase sigma-70 factor (ECF subfamily)
LQPTDRELTARFVEQGDDEAFRLLFRRYTPRLYAVALRCTACAPDAEDVVQNSWQRAAGLLGAFEWRSSLSTWLVGIVINCAREHRRALPVEGAGATPVAEPSVAAPAVLLAIDLERAIALLSDRHRQVVVLHDIEGWTHAEIAAHLGIAVGTSKSDLFHARRTIRAALGPVRRMEIR